MKEDYKKYLFNIKDSKLEIEKLLSSGKYTDAVYLMYKTALLRSYYGQKELSKQNKIAQERIDNA